MYWCLARKNLNSIVLSSYTTSLSFSLQAQKQDVFSVAMSRPVSMVPGGPVATSPVARSAQPSDIPDFDHNKAKKLRVLGLGGMSVVWLIEYKGMHLAAKTPKPGVRYVTVCSKDLRWGKSFP